jgi:hypothetical protein
VIAAALIFIIAVEILACRIREDNNLKGIQIKLEGRTHSLKLSQLADDTTIFSTFSLQCFKHPIHIPSVLFLFSIRPENEPNVLIILRAIDISFLD